MTPVLFKRLDLRSNLAQTVCCLAQRVDALAESEAHLALTSRCLVIEAGARYGRDAATMFLGPPTTREPARIIVIGALTQGAEVGQDVIRALRRRASETRVDQSLVKQVAPLPVVARQTLVVLGAKLLEAGCTGFLQWRRCADREKVVHFAHGRRDVGGRDDGADAPPGHTERFRRSTDGHGAIAHAIDGRQRNMLAVVANMLVDLIRDGEHIVLLTKLRNGFQFEAR